MSAVRPDDPDPPGGLGGGLGGAPLRQTLAVVVDRSAETLALLRDVIEEAGMLAVVQQQDEIDDEALLDFIAAHRPSVVLFELDDPAEADVPRFRALREDARASSCGWVALTSSRDVYQRLRQSGECAAARKPFDFEELMAAIAEALPRPD